MDAHNRRRPPAWLRSGLAFGLLLPLLATAADPMLEARVSKLERMLSEQRQSDLLLQLQQLQQEVQELRGLVEKQQFLLQRQGRLPNGIRPPSEPDMPVQHLSPPPQPSLPLPESPASQGTRIELSTGDTLPALPAPETLQGGERDLYREAFEHLKARDYATARMGFEKVLKRFPRGDFADNSRYWLGEISYQAQDYGEARAAFEQLIQNYPNSPKVPGAMLKLGYLDYDENQLEQARARLEAVVRRFPESAEGRLAARRLYDMDRLDSVRR
jgi:tol-pal system protein YbgF